MDSSNKYKCVPDNAAKRKREEENSLFPPSKRSNEGKMSNKTCCQDMKNETKIKYETLLSDLFVSSSDESSEDESLDKKCVPDNAAKRTTEDEHSLFLPAKKCKEDKIRNNNSDLENENEAKLNYENVVSDLFISSSDESSDSESTDSKSTHIKTTDKEASKDEIDKKELEELERQGQQILELVFADEDSYRDDSDKDDDFYLERDEPEPDSETENGYYYSDSNDDDGDIIEDDYFGNSDPENYDDYEF
ncbi:17S U2 SnRNP complex component HTATSF1-like [Cherax quadricarinatus]